MFNLNKKGLSNLIGIVFLISMSLAGLGIIFNAIAQIPEQSLSPALECTEFQLNPPLEINEACYNFSSGDIELIIQRSVFDDSQINDLDFLVSLNNRIISLSCGLSCGNDCKILNSGETKKYFLTVDEIPDEITMQINGCFIESSKISIC